MIELIVNKSYIKRNDNDIITSGRVDDTSINCTFVDDGWDGLDKYAVFTVLGIEKPIKVKLSDNKCRVPVEALAESGPIIIGVYGEQVDGDKVVKRISPAAVAVTVRQGSYVEGAIESPTITINEWFAKQAAEAKSAANAAVKAAKIADEIMQILKGGSGDE